MTEIGKSTGFTNGMSKERSLAKDTAQDSGDYKDGFTNGMAMGYEQGMTNGMAKAGVDGKVRVIPVRHKMTGLQKKKQLFVSSMLIIAMLFAPFMYSYTINEAPILIDGLFADWEEVVSFNDGFQDVFNSNIDIQTYKLVTYGEYAYIYLSSVEELLVGEGDTHDTLIVLADTDSLYETGYQANGLGYDYMVKVSGLNNEIVSKSAHTYQGNGNDWSRWKLTSSVGVAMLDNEIEIKIPTSSPDMVVADAYLTSARGEVDQLDCFIGNSYHAIRVEQFSIAPDVCEIGMTDLINIQISSDANTSSVSELKFTMDGTARQHDFGRFFLTENDGDVLGTGFMIDDSVSIPVDLTIIQDQPMNICLSANILSGDSHTFTFKIESPYDVSSTKACKVYDCDTRFTYIGSIPTTPTIDGGFAEWSLTSEAIDTSCSNENVNVVASDSLFKDRIYSMAVSYQGRAFDGSIMPFKAIIEVGATPVSTDADDVSTESISSENIPKVEYTVPDPLTGEDVLIVYVGDYKKVDIRGVDGYITKSVYSLLINGSWVEYGAVNAMCDQNCVEFAIDDIVLEESDNILIVTSDWEGNSDRKIHKIKKTTLTFGTREIKEPVGNLGSITDMTAFQTNVTDLLVGGDLGESEWETDADNYTVNLFKDIKVYTMMDADYTYIGVISLNDTTVNALDECWICFDLTNNESSSPDLDDVSFRYYQMLSLYYEGDGSTWDETLLSGYPYTLINKGLTNSRVSWELKVSNDILDAYGNYSDTGEKIGFCVYVMDYSTLGGQRYHIFYPDAYNAGFVPTVNYHYQPDTWADLGAVEIPEFNNVAVMAIGMLFLVGGAIFIRRRD